MRFILGRAGSGKTDYCLKQIAALDKITNRPLLFLLPEQATFTHERLLATKYSRGFSRAEVLSFRRLIWQAAGQNRLPALSTAGKEMLMANLIQKHKGQLKLFNRSHLGRGFAAAMVKLAEEMLNHALEPELLNSYLSQMPATNQSDKLADIDLLYSNYCEAILGNYDNFPDGLNLLAKKILEEDFLADATVFIDGFSYFNNQEIKVIEALIQKAARLEICLLLDPAEADQPLNEHDLFYQNWHLYSRLTALGHKLKAHIEPPIICDGQNGRFKHSPELAFIEQNLYNYKQKNSWPNPPQNLQIICAENPRNELIRAALIIQNLVREQGLRYRDICLISRDISPYQQLLEGIFSDIPYFIDSPKKLFFHPLVELMRSLLEIWQNKPHYQAIFRYFKTGLSTLSEAQVDKLENYCLGHGIKAWQWLNDEDWHYLRSFSSPEAKQAVLAEINLLRQLGITPIKRFLQAAPNACEKQVGAYDLLQALLDFCQEDFISQKLNAHQEQALVDSDAEQAFSHRQVLDKLMEYLQEAQILFVDSYFTAAEISEIIDQLCQSMTLALIPPGLDQVLIASLDRSRSPEIKAAIVIGLNADVLPQKIMPQSLLSDFERQELAAAGLVLAPATNLQQMAENYLAYIALSRAEQYMFLLYSQNDSQGAALLPSPLIAALQQMFPNLMIKNANLSEDAACLRGGYHSLGLLAQKLAAYRETGQISDFWLDVLAWYNQQDAWQQALSTINDGLYFKPLQGNLAPYNLDKLYPHTLKSSVSRLERFKACPFAYLAAYGLKLAKRDIYEVSPAARGEVFHHVLSEIGRKIAAGDFDWPDLNPSFAKQLIEDIFEQFMPEFLDGILLSSAHYQYLALRIKQTLISTLLLISKQMQSGQFVQVAWELPFGFNEEQGLPPLSIELADQRFLQLSGRIDRIDIAQGANGAYMRVIDYKSGDNQLKPEEIFYGLKMQLLLYMQVVLTNSAYFCKDSLEAAGLYYMTVQDQLLSMERPPAAAAINPPGLRLKGLTIHNPEAIILADNQVNGSSAIIPVQFSAKSGIYKNSPGLTAEQLDLLKNHLLTTLRQSAEAILSGLMDIKPYQSAKFEPCPYCDYAALCAFDGELAEREPRPSIAKDKLWQILEGSDEI